MIKICVHILFLFQLLLGQYSRKSPDQNLIKQSEWFGYKNHLLSTQRIKNHKNINLLFTQLFYNNSNLPNFENFNGRYFPKGYGFYSSAFFSYASDRYAITFEPVLENRQTYTYSLPEKNKIFSVLNDVPKKLTKTNNLLNTGVELYHKNLIIGAGNWSQWWGPGIHSSLVLSNNTEGFFNYFISSKNYIPISENLMIKGRYFVSEGIKNRLKKKFYYSAFLMNIKYKLTEIGISKHILSGGHPDLSWNIKDAASFLITNKNKKYWDTINHFYLLKQYKDIGLEIFLEFGYPNRSYGNNDPELYYEHARGTNIGFRKRNIFDNDRLIFGLEYARLVQSSYYNILPSPNWYDNFKYNYSSFNDRRWGAHSGSDSDDLFIYLGYVNDDISYVYEFNYERHGVSYHFPPEIKYENRLIFKYNTNQSYSISINYENEMFVHYGFIDSQNNVWSETFEKGSIQRTNSIVFSLKKIIL